MKYENTLEDHFPDHDIHDEVACECNEALQVGSLTEHIISRKHYGTAGTHCDRCFDTRSCKYAESTQGNVQGSQELPG